MVIEKIPAAPVDRQQERGRLEMNQAPSVGTAAGANGPPPGNGKYLLEALDIVKRFGDFTASVGLRMAGAHETGAAAGEGAAA